MAQTWKYAVTWESDTAPPETLRGEVSGTVTAASGRALRLAKKAKPTKNHWQSVLVLLEKLDKA